MRIDLAANFFRNQIMRLNFLRSRHQNERRIDNVVTWLRSIFTCVLFDPTAISHQHKRKNASYTFSSGHVHVTYKDNTIEQNICWRKKSVQIENLILSQCILSEFGSEHEWSFSASEMRKKKTRIWIFSDYDDSNRISEIKRKEDRSRSKDNVWKRWTKADGHVNEGKGKMINIVFGRFLSLKYLEWHRKRVMKLRVPLEHRHKFVDAERNQRRHVCQYLTEERLQSIYQVPVHRDQELTHYLSACQLSVFGRHSHRSSSTLCRERSISWHQNAWSCCIYLFKDHRFYSEYSEVCFIFYLLTISTKNI